MAQFFVLGSKSFFVASEEIMKVRFLSCRHLCCSSSVTTRQSVCGRGAASALRMSRCVRKCSGEYYKVLTIPPLPLQFAFIFAQSF